MMQEDLKPAGPRPRHDLAFTIAAVDAYHLVVPQATYWNEYRAGNRSESTRFMLKPGWRTVYARQVESALVRVTFDDGSVGWGEATEPICPEVICRLATQLLAPLAGGTAFAEPAALWDFCYDLNRGRGHTSGYQLLAMAALDIAVWDALGRRLDLPVCRLLSEAPRDSIAVYLSGIRRASVGERIELMRGMTAEGLRGAKIFVGGDTADTLREVEQLRNGVPGAWQLMTDALWSYSDLASAADAKRLLAPYQVRWLECPLVPEDLPGHAELARLPGVPIALGESFNSYWQAAPWLTAGAVDVLQPDIGRTGFSDGIRLQKAAESSGIAVTAHMGSGTPLVQAAALTFDAVQSTDLLAECQFDLGGILPDVFQTGWVYRQGEIAVPDRGGLGVEIDVSALERHCALVERWRRT